MKVLYTVILFLCAICTYSQEKQQNNENGMYAFQKATFTTYNNDTKAEVAKLVIEDPASEVPSDLFYARNIFLQASVQNGELTFCKTLDGSSYLVKYATELTLIEGVNKEKLPQEVHTQLSPYSLSINDNILTFTVDLSYGDSRYNFPVEGKLTLTMIKQ